jgi:hypothetical protein
VVPSFTLNIDPLVVLKPGRRVARVKVIASCAKGQRLNVVVDLAQHQSAGGGAGNFRCLGRLTRYLVIVRTHGHRPFSTGTAHATARAAIRSHGSVVNRQRWARAVKLASCTRGAHGSCRLAGA